MSQFRIIENPLKSRLCLSILFEAIDLDIKKQKITNQVLGRKTGKSRQSISNALMSLTGNNTREPVFIRKDFPDARFKFYEINYSFLANELALYNLSNSLRKKDNFQHQYEGVMLLTDKESQKFVQNIFLEVKRNSAELVDNGLSVNSINDVFRLYKTARFLNNFTF